MRRALQMLRTNYNKLEFSSSSDKVSLICSSLDLKAGGQNVRQVEGCLLIAFHGPSLLWIARKAKLASRAAGEPM